MKRQLIKILGGYTSVEDCLENMDKEQVLTEAVKHLYNTIGSDDILKQANGTWTFLGKEITPEILKLLTAESRQLLSSRIWKVIESDIKYQANLQMFLKSKSEMDLTAGKLWLYVLDAIKTRLNTLSKIGEIQ
jgi:hypothetical protein